MPTLKMVGLWQLMLVCWAGAPLSLSSRVSFIGSPQECKNARFVPGYNLGGEGFDIVTMERKGAYVIDTETWDLGNGTCRMYQNDYMSGERQKVPTAVVDWRTYTKCRLAISSKVYDSVESLVRDSTSSVSNDWKIGLDIPSSPFGVSFGGSHSKASTFGMEKSKKDHYTFFGHSVHCNFYRYRLAEKPSLSREFGSVVGSLPSYGRMTEYQYYDVVKTYGTHYMTNVLLGGEIKAITSIKTCLATMNGLSETEVKDCLSVEASASLKSTAKIKAMVSRCKDKRKRLSHGQSFSSVFSERCTEVTGGKINGIDILFQGQSDDVYNRWINSLKDLPDVVKYSIKPLHTILPTSHHARAGLKQEVEKYIKQKAVLKKCSESCPIGQRSSKRDPCACVCTSNQLIKSNCCPAGKGLATLKVFGLYAKNLYGDRCTQTDGSVEVEYDGQVKRTAIIPNNDNPRWSEVFQFGPIVINMANKLRFTVYDEDSYWNSDLLGSCSFRLRSGRVSDSCMFTYGTFYFSYEVECAPSLGGIMCQDYISSPMSTSLAKLFYTRNGVLAGDA